MGRKGKGYHGSIKTIWGLAKSPELMLDEETLYMIVYRETKKDSIRELSQGEIDRVCRVLSNMKDDAKKAQAGKRTDENGNAETEQLRKKIYYLTEELGWNDNNNRIHGFVKRMFSIDRIEWLSAQQCIKLIEVLKKMVEREEAKRCGSEENSKAQEVDQSGKGTKG